jgi:hypothetical protein
MKRAEAMRGNGTVARLKHIAHDESAARATRAGSWDPFEVWLTRVKQPRDRAAKSGQAGTSAGISDRRD